MSQAKRLKVTPAADGQPAAQTRRIHLWSPPRACSTAMMYSFHNRPDTTVVRDSLTAIDRSGHINTHLRGWHDRRMSLSMLTFSRRSLIYIGTKGGWWKRPSPQIGMRWLKMC